VGGEGGCQVAGADDELYDGRAEVALVRYLVCGPVLWKIGWNTLNKASALGDGRLDVLKTGRVLVTAILVGVDGLVGSDIRHVLHLSVILERSLGADNDLGIHCW
jgi:hypothetical protein